MRGLSSRIAAGLLILAYAGLPATAHALITSVEVVPPKPTTADDVRIAVSGYFPDLCWSVSGGECGTDGNSISIDIYGVDAWQPGYFCAQVIIPYHFKYDLGRLRPGDYTVMVTEHHQSLRDPFPDFEVIEFRVRRRAVARLYHEDWFPHFSRGRNIRPLHLIERQIEHKCINPSSP